MFISFKIINVVAKKIVKRGGKKHSDKTIFQTLAYVLKIGLKIIVVICLIGYLGIDTSGLTALIASLGVGIGLAVNGALSNLAGGILIILTRPFKIDDYIEVLGYAGTVVDIHITNTKLLTPDNKVIYPSEGEVYVPVCYRKEYGIKSGDVMRIGKEELIVAGFLRDSQMNSMMASSKRFLVCEEDYEAMQALDNAAWQTLAQDAAKVVLAKFKETATA